MAQLATTNARIERDVAADAPPLAPAEPTIDRAHLARMTQGERDLEREVLQLYATQTDVLLRRMLAEDLGRSPSTVIAALAHTLSGSSRSIGAWQVADAAFAVETDAGQGRDITMPVQRLASAIRAAQLEIVELMRVSA
jgi:HPt (histidine-containing phosphotransfer) domain-containing protein